MSVPVFDFSFMWLRGATTLLYETSCCYWSYGIAGNRKKKIKAVICSKLTWHC